MGNQSTVYRKYFNEINGIAEGQLLKIHPYSSTAPISAMRTPENEKTPDKEEEKESLHVIVTERIQKGFV